MHGRRIFFGITVTLIQSLEPNIPRTSITIFAIKSDAKSEYIMSGLSTKRRGPGTRS